MIKVILNVISEESISKTRSPFETPSNEFQTKSDIAMVNVLETTMKQNQLERREGL